MIKELKDISKEFLNEMVDMVVLLTQVNVKIARSGKKYVDLLLQDTSRTMEAKFWDYEARQDLFDAFDNYEIVRIKGTIGQYREQVQLTIKEIDRVEGNEFTVKDFLQTSPMDFNSMIKALRIYRDKIKSPHLQKLVDEMVFSEEFYDDFTSYPAASKVHHNFYHGLLHHSLEVLNFANVVASTKKLSPLQIERLYVMAILHDWGKIFEYRELPEVGFTDEGIMLGHIFMGAHFTLKKIDQIEDFPQEDKLVILNGILGHHGSLEFGSPVLPKTVEAQILHQADKMSGDVESILSHISDEREERGNFTSKLWNMGREYYKK